MNPIERYQEALKQKKFQEDEGQQASVYALNDLHQRIMLAQHQQNSITHRIRNLFQRKKVVQGLYLWGGVGRGKTWLMDLFYDALPIKNKYRSHFHRYIREIHEQLDNHKGKKNPLRHIAREFSRQYRLLCLDEFHVSDITDAMILHGLLKALLEQGVILVFTSNIEPDDLYKEGLQRERFIPAIKLIKQFNNKLKIEDGIDHRLNTMQQNEAYYFPLNETNQIRLEQYFLRLCPCPPKTNTSLKINHRDLPVYKMADDVAWFIFDQMFNSPRAVADYIELAKLFHTVFISGIPYLSELNEDKTRRFIQLMDEFYDRNVKVIMSAVDTPEKLYQGKILKFEFERTVSRMEEMKSVNYLQKPHKP